MRITTQMRHWDGCSNPKEEHELPYDGPELMARLGRRIAAWEADGGTIAHWGGVDDDGNFEIEFIPSDDAQMAGPEGVFRICEVRPRALCCNCGDPIYKGEDCYFAPGCEGDDSFLCCSAYCAEEHGHEGEGWEDEQLAGVCEGEEDEENGD